MSDRDDLLKLILEVSFEKRKVTLTSGRESDFYLDLRQTLMHPQGVALGGKLLLEKLHAGTPVDTVGGMAVGTLFTLFVIPSIYMLIAKDHRLAA